MYQLNDYDYQLPDELIARYPVEQRSASRLLVLNKVTGELQHSHFHHLIDYLDAGDVLVLNNTKVFPARLLGQKETGGQIEILIERILNEKQALAHIRASKAPKPGMVLKIADQAVFTVEAKQNDLYTLHAHDNIFNIIQRFGEIPLPPYFGRQAEASDNERYQTVYAEHTGSVAAPTAGLHFDEALLTALKDKGIQVVPLTLHVGAGTFQPVRQEDIRQHQLHYEWIELSAASCDIINAAQRAQKKIIAVGTTSARALETIADENGQVRAFSGETNLFIYPGYKFKIVKGLITNFHLPQSSLLMLVCALGGYEFVMHAYQQAIEHKYRFYSYGDATLIL